MTLTTRQEARYEGNDWWQWSVWLDGTQAELDEIRCVTYHLHSTFPKPERKIEERATSFRLDSAGWGEFTLRAVVETKNGEKRELFHDLILDYPAGSGADAPVRGERQPRIFLSYSILDERLADTFRKVLGSRGIEVLDPADVEPGQDFAAELPAKLRKADGVVALISESSGRSVMAEIETARKNRTPVVAVELGEGHHSLPEGIPRLPLRDERDVEAISDSLMEAVRHAATERKKR